MWGGGRGEEGGRGRGRAAKAKIRRSSSCNSKQKSVEENNLIIYRWSWSYHKMYHKNIHKARRQAGGFRFVIFFVLGGRVACFVSSSGLFSFFAVQLRGWLLAWQVPGTSWMELPLLRTQGVCCQMLAVLHGVNGLAADCKSAGGIL